MGVVGTAQPVAPHITDPPQKLQRSPTELYVCRQLHSWGGGDGHRFRFRSPALEITGPKPLKTAKLKPREVQSFGLSHKYCFFLSHSQCPVLFFCFYLFQAERERTLLASSSVGLVLRA